MSPYSEDPFAGKAVHDILYKVPRTASQANRSPDGNPGTAICRPERGEKMVCLDPQHDVKSDTFGGSAVLPYRSD